MPLHEHDPTKRSGASEGEFAKTSHACVVIRAGLPVTTNLGHQTDWRSSYLINILFSFRARRVSTHGFRGLPGWLCQRTNTIFACNANESPTSGWRGQQANDQQRPVRTIGARRADHNGPQTHQPPVPVPARGQEAGGRVASGEVLTPFPSASPFFRPGQHHGEAALDLGALVAALADGSVSPVR